MVDEVLKLHVKKTPNFSSQMEFAFTINKSLIHSLSTSVTISVFIQLDCTAGRQVVYSYTLVIDINSRNLILCV